MTLAHTIKNRGWLAIAALTTTGALLMTQGSTLGSAQTAYQYDRLVMSGAEENPAVTTARPHAGLFSASFDAVAKTLQADISGDGLELFTAAHLHLGAKGTNGPVVVSLFSSADGVTNFHATPLVNADSLAGPLKGDWDGFVKALAEGNIYANSHTKDHPGGVLRVQLPAHPEFLPKPAAVVPKPPVTGSGLASDGGSDSTVLFGAILIGTAVVGATYMTTRRKRA